MQGSYVALRSSSSLFGHCNTMEMQEDNSYFKQPLMLSERLAYADPQPPYYDALQGLAHQESVTRSVRIPPDAYRNAAPAFNLGLSTDLLPKNGFRDAWQYDDPLEAQEQSFGPDFRPSPTQCLNKEFGYHAPSAYGESYKMADASDAEAYKEDMTSSSTSPRIDSSPPMEVWPFIPEEPMHAFHTETGLLTKDSHDDEEGSGDKPYARLIHEALMQAPGHRMMLREIYDWFVQNTTKPSESGTNGWQNSIRHNLSMNQVSGC